ncbi:hypothetical protein CKA32_004614 [Geitlerinema sp. FC II]|nr:hypothetical protein CKA32_004614 [Geitlerinema sp. FC II]
MAIEEMLNSTICSEDRILKACVTGFDTVFYRVHLSFAKI